MVKLHYFFNNKNELIGWQTYPILDTMPVVELTEEEFKQLQDNFEKGIFKPIEPKK